MSDFLQRISQLSPKRLALLAMELQEKLERLEQEQQEPIAIIGMGCRFPGGANDAESYWQLLRDGVDAIREVPPDRWDIEAYYDPDPDAPGKMSTRYGGFLDQVDQFDPHFFGISPREAASMDPQQRLLLEVTWEALEHAGLAAERLEGSATGVFLGICSSDYPQLLLGRGPEAFDAYLATGASHAIASGRLSYVLGVHGPSLSIDTACSSSLVAVHLACLHLRSRTCRLALAGGVNVMLTPDTTITLSKARMMSPDGRCKTFDASANGFVRGEGCGMVVLKRLRDALRDGDNILALILASACNQDGRSSGITAPNGPAQEAVMREALRQAHLAPRQIGYVETHGTGTSLGDPIEVNALAAVLGRGREPGNRLLLGSVKTNFGHLEGAAGIAGLLKLVLALQHKHIPPHLHLRQRNPYIPWEDYPFDIPTVLTPWLPIDGRRIGATSSFGFSGTNAHLVVAEWDSKQAQEWLRGSDAKAAAAVQGPAATACERPLHLLTLSAKSKTALQELARRYAGHLAAHPEVALADVCFTANTGRSHFSQRAALLADTTAAMQEKLAALAAGETAEGVMTGEPAGNRRAEVVFLFTGQGAQYPGMARRLYETQPVFRAALQKCDELLRPHLEMPLLTVLFSESPSLTTGHLLHQTAYTQPALFAVEYALAELWHSWGVEPAAVMGHSVGEYVAACVAGMFSLEDGLKLIASRGRLMQALPANGAMSAVFAAEARVRQAIAAHRDTVDIAAINGPDNIVISGEAGAVAEIVGRLAGEGIKSKSLEVSHAFHSPLMEPMLEAFEQIAATVNYQAPRIPVLSNLTAAPLDFANPGGAQHDLPPSPARAMAGYWRRHVRQAVRFSDSIMRLHQEGHRIFLEIGPQPVLLGMAGKCLEAQASQRPAAAPLWLPSLRRDRDDWQQMLQSLAALYLQNVNIDWSGFDRAYPRRRVVLPSYPFQRERYWLEPAGAHKTPAAPPRQRAAAAGQPVRHPLLGRRLAGPLPVFEPELSRAALKNLLDEHRACGIAVVPGVVVLEMALGAAVEALAAAGVTLEDVVLHDALVLPEEDSRTVQLILTPEAAERATFQLFSSAAENVEEHGAWQRHASGRIIVQQPGKAAESIALAAIRESCPESAVSELLERVRRRGIQLTPQSQTLARLWRRPGEALGLLHMNEAVRRESGAFQLHPALLDACLHTLEAALPEESGAEGTYMLMGLARLEWLRRPGTRMWAHARLADSWETARETLTAEMTLCDDDGGICARFSGLQFKRALPLAVLRSQLRQLNNWLYEVQWQPRPADAAAPPPPVAFLPGLAEIAGIVQPHIDRIYRENNLAVYDELLPRLDAVCGAYVCTALQQLGFGFTPGKRFQTEELMTSLRVQARHRRLFERLLFMLQEDGWLQAVDGAWQVIATPAPRDPAAEMNALLAAFPACATELAITQRCAAGLAAALTGAVDPLHLLFPGGSLDDTEQLYQEAPNSRAFNLLLREAVAAALQHLPPERRLTVLEIGGGTGGTTSRLLPMLPAGRTEYVFTDIGQLFLTRAAQKFKDYSFVRYQMLDISADPLAQNFAPHHFDVIVAANVLHATADLRTTLANVRQLLAPGGLLVLLEGSLPQRFGDLTVGLTEGWWSYADRDLRPDYALLSPEKWLTLLHAMNFTDAVALPEGATRVGVLRTQAVILARAPLDVSASNAGASKTKREKGSWIILADKGGVAEQLAQRLAAEEQTPILVHAGENFAAHAAQQFRLNPGEPEDFKRLLREALTPDLPRCCGVVHLWALDAPPHASPSASELATLQNKITGSALHMVQAMATAAATKAARLWLVTRRAQPVGEHRGELAAWQAPLWGLGKVIAMEHPEWRCTLVDLDAADGAHELYQEIMTQDDEDQIARRGGRRHVPRLVASSLRLDQPAKPGRLPVSGDATYLITGGLAGLGLLTAHWLVAQGARHLVLLGRSSPSEAAQATIREMESEGAQIIVTQADVADYDRMAQLFASIDASLPPLRGIIHSAGAIDDGVLLQQNWPRFEKVMRAKVPGAWNLHLLSRGRPLDFFVLYSTGASLVGSAGQGNHAAANAFMDVLAQQRAALGLPALSINWGAWAEIGTVTRHRQSDRFTLHGKSTITPLQGLLILERLLQEAPPQIGVLPVDWGEAFAGMGARLHSPFFAEIRQGVCRPTAVSSEQRDGSQETQPATLPARLTAAPVSKRRQLLEQFVQEQAMKVLGLSRPVPLQQPLTELGLDSLMAVELRNALGKGVEQTLPATLLFDHPAIENLVEHLGKNVLGLEMAATDGEELPKVNGRPVVAAKEAELDALSDEEIAALLEEKLR
ncbi:MAG: type I polyketide synthase [candidate division KSB1 bacterium]|nr:type I polyketide synthase [candidate division KSB1 bacterium]